MLNADVCFDPGNQHLVPAGIAEAVQKSLTARELNVSLLIRSGSESAKAATVGTSPLGKCSVAVTGRSKIRARVDQPADVPHDSLLACNGERRASPARR